MRVVFQKASAAFGRRATVILLGNIPARAAVRRDFAGFPRAGFASTVRPTNGLLTEAQAHLMSRPLATPRPPQVSASDVALI
jgi:hypothetical protein